jgi:hypothetical protein
MLYFPVIEIKQKISQIILKEFQLIEDFQKVLLAKSPDFQSGMHLGEYIIKVQRKIF